VLALYGEGFAGFIGTFSRRSPGCPIWPTSRASNTCVFWSWHAADDDAAHGRKRITAVLADRGRPCRMALLRAASGAVRAGRRQHAVVSLWAAHQAESAGAGNWLAVDHGAGRVGAALSHRELEVEASGASGTRHGAASSACTDNRPPAYAAATERVHGARTRISTRRRRWPCWSAAGAITAITTPRRTRRMNTLATASAAERRLPLAPLRLLRAKASPLLGNAFRTDAIALLGRFSPSPAVFWKSGQTKVAGLCHRHRQWRVHSSACPSFRIPWWALFREEYKLPLLPPELAAPMAAFAEHLFPLLILIGLATRFSALALLVHDGDNTTAGVSGCLPNPRRLGGRVAVPCRPGTGRPYRWTTS
jgi:hypothetical protein